RDGSETRYLLADGTGAALPEAHPLTRHDWLVVVDTDGRFPDARVRLAWGLDQSAVAALLPARTTVTDQVTWDDRSGRVVARRVRSWGAIEVESQPLNDPPPALLQNGLLEGIRARGLAALPWNEPLLQWRARAHWLHRLHPGDWPDFSDEALLTDLEQWLAPFLSGCRHWRDLGNLPLKEALLLRLGPQRQDDLNRLLPVSVRVASGRQVRLDYCVEASPRLAVKLQECFGMTELPSLANGQLAITVDLLTPAGRT